MKDSTKKRISIRGVDQLKLFGFEDNHLRSLEKEFDTKIVARGNEILLEGESDVVAKLEKIIYEMILMTNRDEMITDNQLNSIIQAANNGAPEERIALTEDSETVILYTKESAIKPKSPGQKEFFKASRENDIVFAIGPAGTGKTFLAVAIAVAALRDKVVNRIILTRPAVEAGERLGFLPGDFREKIDPYLRPLYDALYSMIPADKLKRYMESRVIEIVPLAYMRGRTLNNAFVILDEAQNTSFNQMKMFLTRLGIHSKAIITGDITQIDLPESMNSGLVQIQSILRNIEGLKFVYLTENDVVRHRLVREIIQAYDQHQKENTKKENGQ